MKRELRQTLREHQCLKGWAKKSEAITIRSSQRTRRKPGERSQIIYELKSPSNLGTSRSYNVRKLLSQHGGKLRISGRKGGETVNVLTQET